MTVITASLICGTLVGAGVVLLFWTVRNSD
jgi:hypothetical protein